MEAVGSAADADREPLLMASSGYFFVGGKYEQGGEGGRHDGHMYVEYHIPERLMSEVPVVMIPGGGLSALSFIGTPDGRDGWMQSFLRAGYAVFIVDLPSQARSSHHEDEGALSRFSVSRIEQRFTSPARHELWPAASSHTQWPGLGTRGDPIFDQFVCQNFPYPSDIERQQELCRSAGSSLLNRIGRCTLLAHSQAGAFAWLIADSVPDLVCSIIAVEPSGPPFHELRNVGAPEWFVDGPLSKRFGLTAVPLSFDPPLAHDESLSFSKTTPVAEGLAPCWEQAGRPRTLRQLMDIPILVVTSEASYHASYDHCTVRFLRQAGVKRVEFMRLPERGISGNGHMMMLEKNNEVIAHLLLDWLDDL